MTTNLDPTRKNPQTQNLSVKITIDNRRTGVLESKDIVECYFIEDLLSANLYGKLVFYDNYGIVEQGPLTGNEMISLVYGVEEVREVVFHVWQITNIVQTADAKPTDTSLIEMYFVDSSFYYLTVPKYSRSFPAQTKHTDVVTHILENMIGWERAGIQLEQSKSSLADNWAIPYWTASQAIQWILKRAIGKDSGTSGYLFYNNTYNTISCNVRTLNWLLSSMNNVDDSDYKFESENPEDQNKIWEWWINGVDHNTLGVVRGGWFRGVDSSQKKLLDQQYSYLDGIKNTVLTGKKALFSDITDYTASQINYGEATLQDLQSVLYTNWVKAYSLQNTLNVIVQGNEKRYAGLQINIKWKSVDTTEQLWQKQLEGKYLIKSITHNFKGSNSINYVQRMVLIKNAYQDSKSQSLIGATKTNLTGGKRQRILLNG